MERTLRNRLTYGPLMLAGLFVLLWLDAGIERWTQPWMARNFHHRGGVPVHGLGGVGILALLLLILPIATDELAVLFTAEQVRPYRIIATFGSGAIVIHGFLTQLSGFRSVAASTLAFIIVFVMLLAALRRAMERQAEQAIVRMAGTVLTTLYLGGLGWFLMAIRVKQSERFGFTGSTSVILMILLVVKFTDIGAYFGGRALGRHKLIPWLSPGKTREGLACGMLLAGIVGAICARFVPLSERLVSVPTPSVLIIYLNYWQGFVFGAVLGGIGQIGDLLESLMKRDAQVKDSGHIIPGFGGILDVIDSPLLASPFAYLMFSLFGLATLS